MLTLESRCILVMGWVRCSFIKNCAIICIICICIINVIEYLGLQLLLSYNLVSLPLPKDSILCKKNSKIQTQVKIWDGRLIHMTIQNMGTKKSGLQMFLEFVCPELRLLLYIKVECILHLCWNFNHSLRPT